MDEHHLRTGRNGTHLTVSRLCDTDLEKKRLRRSMAPLYNHLRTFHILFLKVKLIDFQIRLNSTESMIYIYINLIELTSSTSFFGGV